MRIRVPRQRTFTAALTLVVFLACSYYVFNARRRLSPSTRAAAFRVDSADAQQSTDADALLAVADRLFVINFGQQLAQGNPTEVINDPQVRRVYMGIEV